MSVGPAAFNQPDVACLTPDQIDNVGRALISLSREIAVLIDRVMVLEAVLDAQGIAVAAAVDSHQPDAALQARIDMAVGAMLDSMLGALRGSDGSR